MEVISKTNRDRHKKKKARVVIIACNTPIEPHLQPFRILSETELRSAHDFAPQS